MKLVQGRTLKDVIKGLRTADAAIVQSFSRTKLLNIFRQVCRHRLRQRPRRHPPRHQSSNIGGREFGETLVLD
ncbi:MAG: hypothetical protein R3F43_16495 [bacterium]